MTNDQKTIQAENDYDAALAKAIEEALAHDPIPTGLPDKYNIEEADLQRALCPVCTRNHDMPEICNSCENDGYHWSGPRYNSSDGLPTLSGPA